MEIKQYNRKEFLLPESYRSMACFHAKILPNGEYMFRIHDCVGGIRLRGDLKNPEEIFEAVEKLRILAQGASQFANYIEENYLSEKQIKYDLRIQA